MRKRWIYVDGEAIEVGEYQPTAVHHVMPDMTHADANKMLNKLRDDARFTRNPHRER